VSQWSYACRGGDPGTAYPYGATYDATKCAEGLTAAADTTDPKYAGCTGGLPALRNMSGNAAEWEDACNESDAPTATASCRTRGGWYTGSGATNLQCEGNSSYAITGKLPTIGFRCCADAL
jgi:formylglycine-generating enzyme required for sulfatase activity